MTPGPLRAAIVAAVVFVTTPLRAADPMIAKPDIVVRESNGVYFVIARFHVARPREVALEVLTDYDRIPQFMPGVETSEVIERGPGRAVVVQEATSRFMMFTKRVHLRLEINESADSLAFEDRCGKSFRRYSGQWRLSDVRGGTDIAYTLTAQPAFDVPEFVLKRLLARDSGAMIAGLTREIEHRADANPSVGSE